MDVVNEVIRRLSQSSELTTGQVRSVSSSVFRLLPDRRIENVLAMCEALLEQRKWALGVVAYDWAFRMKKAYTAATFDRFEGWLERYVRGWGDCDDFCTHAFGELLAQQNHLAGRTLQWTGHPDFWVRRAAAVILIHPIRTGRLGAIDPFIIADRLMQDDHHLVLKGYGWMLKVLSTVRPDEVGRYLEENKRQMPRVSFRYAAEKLDLERRKGLFSWEED